MERLQKPQWLKKRIPSPQEVLKVKSILEKTALHTVCEEARCPNLGECFAKGTATLLILGRICTRDCRFCAVEHGAPAALDREEPENAARAVKAMGLRYVVITSVTRDDLPDGGASHYADVIRAIRSLNQGIRIEVLIPDFKGEDLPLKVVLKESPDVLNHNVETVPRLYPMVRPQADYERSIHLLKSSKKQFPQILTKSGFMLGLEEETAEVLDLMRDLRKAEVDFLTIGQYLQPRSDRLPVVRYLSPEEFEALKESGEAMGFRSVSAGPFVRSSFNASRMFGEKEPSEDGG